MLKLHKDLNRSKNRGLLLFGVAELLSLLCATVLVTIQAVSPYEMLFALPLGYGLISVAFIELYGYCSDSPVCVIVLICLLIKNTVTPFMMSLGGYYTYFKLITSDNVVCAVVLMLWDSFCILSLLLLYKKGVFSAFKKRASFRKMLSEKAFGCIIVALMFACVVISFVEPSVRSGFVPILSGTAFQEDGLAVNTFEIGSSERVLYTLFMFLFPIVQLLLTSYLMLLIKRKFGDTGLSVLVCFVMVLLQGLFMNGSDGWTVILIGALLIAIHKSFPAHRSLVLWASAIVFATIAVLVYLSKTGSYSVFEGRESCETLSFMLQAYFPGVSNTAGVFYAPLSDPLRSFLYDCYFTIPFRNSIFGIPGDYRAVIEYTSVNVAPSSILPCVGQGFYYLGPLFAPLFSCLLVYIALNCEKSLTQMKSPLLSAGTALLMLYAALSPFLYNMTLFGMRFLFTLLPVLLLSRCMDERTMNEQKRHT